jgi:hypothetical protein
MKSLTYKVITLAFSLATLLLWSGCAEEKDSTVLTTAGVALTVDFLGDTDVTQMRFTLMECGDATILDEVDVDLSDMYLPHAPEYFPNPTALRSDHLFADAFFWVGGGCYDVKVLPLNSSGEESDDCGGADREGVQVDDGGVTEITLLMQCEGPDAGGLDVAGTLNHPPTIEAITYSPSKFVFVCESPKSASARPIPMATPW